MRRNRPSMWSDCGLSIAFSAFWGLCTAVMCTALFAALTFFLMDSMEFSSFFGNASLVCGAVSGGYVCGRFRRRRGLAEGLLCGIVMYAAMCVIGLAAAGVLPSIKKLLLLSFFCAAGGVAGVNSKRPKKLTSD